MEKIRKKTDRSSWTGWSIKNTVEKKHKRRQWEWYKNIFKWQNSFQILKYFRYIIYFIFFIMLVLFFFQCIAAFNKKINVILYYLLYKQFRVFFFLVFRKTQKIVILIFPNKLIFIWITRTSLSHGMYGFWRQIHSFSLNLYPSSFSILICMRWVRINFPTHRYVFYKNKTKKVPKFRIRFREILKRRIHIL